MKNKIRLILLVFITSIFSEANKSISNIEDIKIIFIYNANDGVINSLYDYAHRKISPSTYSCNLCFITYDNWQRNEIWSQYLSDLPMEVDFLYKDSIYKFSEFDIGFKLPIILLKEKGDISVLIKMDDINKCKNEIELIKLLDQKLISSGIIE